MIVNKNNDIRRQNIQSSSFSTLATISLSTAIGGIIGGLSGALVGFGTSAVDEFLISQNIYNNHFLSSSIFWSTTALTPIASYLGNLSPSYKTPIYFCSLATSTLITTYTDDFLDYKKKIETPLGAFLTITKLFDEKNIISEKEMDKIYDKFLESPIEAIDIITNDFSEIYNNKFLCTYFKSTALSLLTVVLDNIFLYYLASYSGNFFIVNLINNYKKGELFSIIPIPKILLTKGFEIIGIYALKSFLEYHMETIRYSLTTEQLQMILEKGTKIILEDGNGRKIIDDKQGQEIINNLTSDLFSLYYFGATKLNDVFSKSSGFLISLNNLQKFASDSFAPYSLSLLPMQVLLRKVAKETKELSEKHSQAESKVWKVMYDIIDNIEQINMRDGEEFVKYKYNSLLSTKTEIAQEAEYLSKFKNAVIQFLIPLNQLIDIIYLGFKVISKQIDIANVPLIKSSIDNLSSFLSGNLIFQIENNNLIIAKQRIDKLLEIISAERNKMVKHIWNDQDGINFKNYSLMLDDKELVRIDNFTFDLSKTYAITGKSGCGKTSTLIDLKSGVSGALSSSGEISIGLIDGQKPKIMFIDQNLYLPSESTLLESIFFPNILSLRNATQFTQLKERVINLLKELEIDEFIMQPGNSNGIISRLDEKEFKLSGGQSKKVAIIQAIINKPDILIMDETFAGLDKKSIVLVEQVLKKYLFSAMILTVDHHAEDNNYNIFYDYEAHFRNGSVILRNISSKELDDFAGLALSGALVETEITVNAQCPNVISFYEDFYNGN